MIAVDELDDIKSIQVISVSLRESDTASIVNTETKGEAFGLDVLVMVIVELPRCWVSVSTPEVWKVKAFCSRISDAQRKSVPITAHVSSSCSWSPLQKLTLPWSDGLVSTVSNQCQVIMYTTQAHTFCSWTVSVICLHLDIQMSISSKYIVLPLDVNSFIKSTAPHSSRKRMTVSMHESLVKQCWCYFCSSPQTMFTIMVLIHVLSTTIASFITVVSLYHRRNQNTSLHVCIIIDIIDYVTYVVSNIYGIIIVP